VSLRLLKFTGGGSVDAHYAICRPVLSDAETELAVSCTERGDERRHVLVPPEACSPQPEARSEVERTSDLDQPRIEDLQRRTPARTVGAVHGADGVRVQRVVRVQVDLDAVPIELEDLRQPQIEAGDTVLEQRLRCNERNGRGRSCDATR
jgi:hypothetical protein